MDITHVVAIVLTGASAPHATPAQIGAMVREADAIWRAHGVSVVLTPTGAGAPAPAAAHLVVDLVAASSPRPAPAGGGALGAIVFDGDNAPATALTIRADAVAALVATSRWSGRPIDQWPRALRDAAMGRALGRVLAHEIGHYLLAFKGHSARGLMRAQFDGDEVSRPERQALTMTPRELPRLRARLAGLVRTVSLAENAQ